MVNYLPRINTTLNDIGLKIAQPPAGPKVTLLGITSNTGMRLNEPYTVSSVEKAINQLYFSGVSLINSSAKYPGELALAIEEAVNAGAQNIEIVVIGHYSGDALISYLNPTLDPTGRFIDLSGAYDVLRNRDLDVVVPVGAYIDRGPTGLSNANFGKQLADFCFQATQEENACVGVISTQPVLEWAVSRASGLRTDSLLSGEIVTIASALSSSSTLTNSQYISGLDTILFGTPSTRLVNEYVLYHTKPERSSAGFNTSVYSSTHYDASYLAWLSGAADQNGSILDEVSESTATAVSTAYFTYWQAKNSDNVLATDSRGVKVDAGGYISVVTAPLVALTTQAKSLALAVGASPGSLAHNIAGSAAYAGLINTLAPQSSTTNKQIQGINSLKLLSVKQANNLVGTRHVTLHSRSGGLSISSGITGSHNVTKYVRSDYTRLTTMRIVQATVDLIRSIGNKYIGEPNNAPRMNALDAEIGAILLALKGQGALIASEHSVSATPDERVLGVLNVNLSLVPAFEITTINLTISLAKELGS